MVKYKVKCRIALLWELSHKIPLMLERRREYMALSYNCM